MGQYLVPLTGALDLRLLASTYAGRFDAAGVFCVNVVGSPGAGKTTLLDLITGRLEPASGTVRVGETVKLSSFAVAGPMPAPGACCRTDSSWPCPVGRPMVTPRSTG